MVSVEFKNMKPAVLKIYLMSFFFIICRKVQQTVLFQRSGHYLISLAFLIKRQAQKQRHTHGV